VAKSDEEVDGTIVIREKAWFSNELTVVFCTGQIVILKWAAGRERGEGLELPGI
jgi:hypothetical protein